MPKRISPLDDDPLWYKDATIYELHLKSFYDSNGDGVGDFQGLTEKLDYIESLGVSAVWILPFYPSPLKDDGYDIADYFDVHPQYGSLKDFKFFLREAHRRGIRVITELVVNHTSDQHVWFQKARRAKANSALREYYVWSQAPEKYKEARIIFKDFETSNWAWDPVAKAYYWHRFYSHQPDLNYDNPRTCQAVLRVLDYWLKMGVDGMRLDAIPYLFEREGTNCENLPETYEFLESLRSHVDKRFPHRMLLAEANQWPEDAVAYFGNGDLCHMAYHFPLMPRLFMAIQMEDRFPIIEILEQTPTIPESCQWALFLRNHDELTLEMVTDEERDYMYRVYARDAKARINLGIRRRLAPLLANERRMIKLMNILLFSMPGSPIIYYGDEIGMGDNYFLGDRNGVRTPMQWSPDRNAGFSKASPQELYLPPIIDAEYHYEAVNVETQERNPASLLWWMRRIITTRKRFKAFGRGTLEFLYPENPKVLAFVRLYEEEALLVVVNLSRFSQVVELDLSKFVGLVPREVFSDNRFPVIKKSPYLLTMGPYNYFWFTLEKGRERLVLDTQRTIPELHVSSSWTEVLEGNQARELFDEILPQYFHQQQVIRAETKRIHRLKLLDSFSIPIGMQTAEFMLMRVDYLNGLSDTYLLPLACASPEEAVKIQDQWPMAVIAKISLNGEESHLVDAIFLQIFRSALLEMVSQRRRLKGRKGELIAFQGKKFKQFAPKNGGSLPSTITKIQRTNSVVTYGDRLVCKLYRFPEEGINPEPEMLQFLSDKTNFEHVPPFAGALEYHPSGAETMMLGMFLGFVQHQGTGWSYIIDELQRFLEQILTHRHALPAPQRPEVGPLEMEPKDLSPVLQELIGGFSVEMIRLLGQRTAELHLALGAPTADTVFDAEPFTQHYQRSIYQSMRSTLRRTMRSLQSAYPNLANTTKREAKSVLRLEEKILQGFDQLLSRKISTSKIRIHGDYHLSQILFTGKDFIIIDFEGEATRALSEKRLKRSPFRDLAGILHSFHYAASTVLLQHVPHHPEDAHILEPWFELWYENVSAIFLHTYLLRCGGVPFIPDNRGDLSILLQTFLLDKNIRMLNEALAEEGADILIHLKVLRHLVRHSV